MDGKKFVSQRIRKNCLYCNVNLFSASQDGETIEQFVEKQISFYAIRNLTCRPFVILQGPIESPARCCVLVHNTTYEIRSPSRAIDVCFKVHKALGCRYSYDSKNAWMFLEKFIYAIQGESASTVVTTFHFSILCVDPSSPLQLPQKRKRISSPSVVGNAKDSRSLTPTHAQVRLVSNSSCTSVPQPENQADHEEVQPVTTALSTSCNAQPIRLSASPRSNSALPQTINIQGVPPAFFLRPLNPVGHSSPSTSTLLLGKTVQSPGSNQRFYFQSSTPSSNSPGGTQN